MIKHRALLLLGVCATILPLVKGAENLRINPKLDYSSDSQDGPLITGDRMQDGPARGKPNYILMYGEG